MGKKKQIDNRIYSFDILEFFRTGERERLDDAPCSIDGNLLYVDRNYYGNKLKNNKSASLLK